MIIILLLIIVGFCIIVSGLVRAYFEQYTSARRVEIAYRPKVGSRYKQLLPNDLYVFTGALDHPGDNYVVVKHQDVRLCFHKSTTWALAWVDGGI